MDLPSKFSKENLKKILDLFNTMSDSPGTESDTLGMNWLKDGNMSGFVDNKWLPVNKKDNSHDIFCPITRKYLSKVTPPASPDVLQSTVENSRKGLGEWSALSPNQRAQHLQRIAHIIERNAELVAQVECLSSGKHLHRTKSVDVPNLIQSFHYYASWAAQKDQYKNLKETGVVCVVSEQKNNPTLSVSLRISSVLAGGNVILVLADEKSCLTAHLLAELCYLSGLPPGVFNVLPINTNFTTLPAVDKFIINSCRPRCNDYIKLAAEQGTPCEVFIPSKPVVIVYESADLHSACDGVLETLFFNDIANNDSCCKVYVQESVQKKFNALLEDKFMSILVGSNLTKTDMTCAVRKSQLEQLQSNIQDAKKVQLKVVEGPSASNSIVVDDDFASSIIFKPVIIFNVPTTSNLFEKIVGPVVITTPFRTVKESIAMFNCNKYSSQVSIWTERITVGLEVAKSLKTRTVWLNSQNLFDASVSHGGLYRQGNSVEGGAEGFFNHLEFHRSNVKETEQKSKVGIEATTSDIITSHIMTENTYGHHIGGSYVKSETRTRKLESRGAIQAYVIDGSNSDIHRAVKSALGVQPKWESLSKYKKSQIFLRAAEALIGKREQLVAALKNLTDGEVFECSKEIEESASIMQFWANRVNTDGGKLTETIHGKTIQDSNALGVIGIQCSDQNSLLSFVALAVPAIIFGNTVVAISSMKYPIPALKICEVLYSCGLPAGVLNVVNGDRAYLTQHLCLNLDVDSVWFSMDGADFIYNSCVTHPKKVFNCKDVWVDLCKDKKLKLELESTVTKNIYMPMGSIFAN